MSVENKWHFVGNIASDIEKRETSGGTTVVSFRLATRRAFPREDGPQADFRPMVAWGKTAEFIAKWFEKGSRIIGCGRIEDRSWDGQDGQKHFITECQIDEVTFGGSKQSGNTSSSGSGEELFG